MQIKVGTAFVVPQPHPAFAAITAAATALTEVIPASIFRAKDANITRAFSAD